MLKIKRKHRLLPPISAILVFITSLWGCATPVDIHSSNEDIQALSRNFATIQHNNLQFSYLENGNKNNGTPHIFVHGTPGSAQGWADFLINVPKDRLYQAIDRFGFGQSQPKNAITKLNIQTQAIHKLINKNDKKAILIGHSLGGPIIVKAAIENPTKIKAIIIVAGALDPNLEEILYIQYLGQIWPLNQILPRQMRNANSELIALKQELITLQQQLHKLNVPTFIVHGTNDTLVPYQNVQFMLNNFPNQKQIKTTTLNNFGHFIPWQAPNQINHVIQQANSIPN